MRRFFTNQDNILRGVHTRPSWVTRLTREELGGNLPSYAVRGGQLGKISNMFKIPLELPCSAELMRHSWGTPNQLVLLCNFLESRSLQLGGKFGPNVTRPALTCVLVTISPSAYWLITEGNATEECSWWKSRYALQWISRQPVMIELCFNFLYTQPGANESICGIRI